MIARQLDLRIREKHAQEAEAGHVQPDPADCVTYEIGSLVKWPETERFSDIVQRAGYHAHLKMTFLPKTKLHGSNVGLHVMPDGSLQVQKRTAMLTDNEDLHDIRSWVASLKVLPGARPVILYGEWCGPGINKGEAVQRIPGKTLFLFAALVDDTLVYKPYSLQKLVTETFAPAEQNPVVIADNLPPVTFDLQDEEQLQKQFSALVDEVEEASRVDRFIKDHYGIEGTGEGFVFFPHSANILSNWRRYLFKVKCKRHAETKKRKRIKPKKPLGIDSFLDEHLTENRMNKILAEQFDGIADKHHMGKVLGAIMSDLKKETVNEMERAAFEWKDVHRYAPPRIKAWFFPMTK